MENDPKIRNCCCVLLLQPSIRLERSPSRRHRKRAARELLPAARFALVAVGVGVGVARVARVALAVVVVAGA